MFILKMQQQRLFTIQQQHQGPDKAAIEQALATQAAATAQAIQQQQQLMQKMMQNMSLYQQQQPENSLMTQQQPSKEQHLSSPKLTAPFHQNELPESELGGLLSKHQEIQQVILRTFNCPKIVLCLRSIMPGPIIVEIVLFCYYFRPSLSIFQDSVNLLHLSLKTSSKLNVLHWVVLVLDYLALY